MDHKKNNNTRKLIPCHKMQDTQLKNLTKN